MATTRYSLTTTQAAPLSEAQYLELELVSELRHEYVDGKLLGIAGETKRHEKIVLNIALALRPQARARGCRLQTKTI